MNERIKRPIKAIIATALCLLAMLVGVGISTAVFQGHIHPDDWVIMWQDKTVVFIIFIIYVIYLYKMSKAPFAGENKNEKRH